jgi:colanic acid/amylovoran biosynthesis protein
MENVLSSYFNDMELCVIAHHKEATSELTGLRTYPPLVNSERLVTLPHSILKALYLSIWALFYSIGVSLPLGSKKETVRAIIDADLVLVSGGGFLNDNYKPAVFGRLYEIFFAKTIGKHVGIYSHSIGPFNTFGYRNLARKVFGRTDIITVRENISAELVNKLQIAVPIHVVPDAAFALNTDEVPNKNIPIQMEDQDKEMVSISVRKWHLYKTDSGHSKYVEALSKVGDMLVERGYKIVFCSTCTGFMGYPMDDRKTAREIQLRIKNKEQVLIIDEYMDPESMINIYSKMSFHIGTRMHSNIYSLMAGTPTIPIAYEHKTLGVMRMFDLEDLVVDINDISPEKVMEKVEILLNDYEVIKGKIESGVERIRMEAFNTPHLFNEVLESK